VSLPPPGGDVIGRRRLDTHFFAFEALGGSVTLNGGFEIHAPALRGARFFLDEPSVTGTENALMAAVLAEGVTVMRNAAAEPHVQDLCHLLNAMGARISGIGTHTLTVEGVPALGGAEFRIGADHIETGSFMGLAAVTRSRIRVLDAPLDHLDSTLLGFRRLGLTCDVEGADLVIHGDRDLVIQRDAFGHVPKVDDGPWPAFPADLTSIALVTATAWWVHPSCADRRWRVRTSGRAWRCSSPRSAPREPARSTTSARSSGGTRRSASAFGLSELRSIVAKTRRSQRHRFARVRTPSARPPAGRETDESRTP
jgi:UDP-N-acetylglucosamine enolpyruvyl transferase